MIDTDSIQTWFKTRHITLKRHWLTDETSNNSFTSPQKLYDHWLNVDLALSTEGSFSPYDPGAEINDQGLVVQLLAYSDIGKSAYSQLKKVNENDDFNDDESTDWKTRIQTKRCYELLLTDGKNKFKAIEKQHLGTLSSLQYGTKFHLSGPITIRNHILLLRCKNIRPLGGVVEKRDIELGQLERRLTNIGAVPPKRTKHFDGKLSILAQSDKPSKQKKSADPKQEIIQKQLPKQEIKQKQQPSKSKQKQVSITNFMKPTSVPQQMETDDWSDDDDFCAAVSNDVQSSRSKSESNIDSAIIIDDDDDWDNDEAFNLPRVSINKIECKTVKKEESKSSLAPELNGVQFLIEIKPSTSCIKILGFIQTLLGKIRRTESGFSVPVKLADGTCTINAIISHNALEQMFERRFPIAEASTKEGKELLKKHGKIGQKNIYDYYGTIQLKRLSSSLESCDWIIENFVDK